MVACPGEVEEARCPVWGQHWMAEGHRVAAPWKWDGSPQADYHVDLTAAPGSWSLQVSMDSSMAATVGEPPRAQVGMSVGNAEAERVLAVPAGVEFAGAGESLDLVGLRHAQRELRASRSYARYCTDQAWRVNEPPEERAVAPAAPEGSCGESPREVLRRRLERKPIQIQLLLHTDACTLQLILRVVGQNPTQSDSEGDIAWFHGFPPRRLFVRAW